MESHGAPCDGVATALLGSDTGVPAWVATVTGVTPVVVTSWGVSLAVSEGSATDGWLGAEDRVYQRDG